MNEKPTPGFWTRLACLLLGHNTPPIKPHPTRRQIVRCRRCQRTIEVDTGLSDV